MTPTAFRGGGERVEIVFAVGECSLGSISVARSERGVCAILLGDDAAFDTLVAQVVGMVEEPAGGLALPLDFRGTAFQQRVWEALRKIPAGAVASYSEVARMIDAPARRMFWRWRSRATG